MRSVRGRWRAAFATGVVLASAVPLAATAIAPHLQCGVTQTGRWERIPVAPFKFVNGISASSKDSISSYSVDAAQPQNVGVTNGYRVQVSRSHGCAWSDAFALSPTPKAGQPFAGVASVITQVGVLNGRFLAAVREGSGATSRPHVLVSATGSSWTAADNGLPAQGSPQLLRVAGDGRTAYLTISPTATGGDGGSTSGVITGLPSSGLPGTTQPTGLLYRTVDGGASWTLQTSPSDLPNGGTGFSQLAVDTGNSNRLYGIVNGALIVSDDGGATFSPGPSGSFTAVTAMSPGSFSGFTSSGTGYISTDGGRHFSTFRAPSNVTSAAYRTGSSFLMTETSGTLRTLAPGGAAIAVPAASAATRGSLLGDRGQQSSFHALSGHSLLRYVDPIAKGALPPPPATGDISVPPPNVGVVVPGVRNIRLPVGSSEREDFTLELPKNPTPLDLFFLVDVSTGMQNAISDVKKNLNRIVSSLTAQRISLKVGVGTLGTGPAAGENDYPDTYVYPPQADLKPDPRVYHKPTLYHRIRQVGAIGPSLTAAINQVNLETEPNSTQGIDPRYTGNHEGQLLALQNVALGLGHETETEHRLGLPSKSEILPGQEAGFRASPDVRRMVILATNEAFDAPYGTDQKPGSDPHNGNPILDFTRTLKILNQNRIQVIGLTAGGDPATDDLRTVAGGTHTLTPAGGVACDGDQTLRAGEPLVCNNGSAFSEAIIRVLGSLVDRQNVRLVPGNRTPVLGALNGQSLLGLDVKRPNTAGFSVQVSCVDVNPGTYAQDVNAVLRSTVVGKARMNVTCVKAAAVTPPKPLTLTAPPPAPAQPAPGPAVPPVAPPVPAAQPQVQPQVNVQTQIQPMTSGAIQEQQELQLALALNGTLKDDDPVFNPGTQLAMVDRRKRDEVQALGVLAFAMT
ncbi:MAG: exo-alpha-sialidase, partial [Frankiales bacterium]|nr:exo-alpha-sialidase [Frankiales bacterium]